MVLAIIQRKEDVMVWSENNNGDDDDGDDDDNYNIYLMY